MLSVVVLPHRLIAFPVKDHWVDQASLTLIEHSAEALAAWLRRDASRSIVMPCVGCGYGRLSWEEVLPRLCVLAAPDLDARIRVIDATGMR